MADLCVLEFDFFGNGENPTQLFPLRKFFTDVLDVSDLPG